MIAGPLVLTRQRRPCARCRRDTFWAAEGQLGGPGGLCLDHASAHPCRDAPQSARGALANLANLAHGFDLARLESSSNRPLGARTYTVWRWARTGEVWRSRNTEPEGRS